MPRIHGQRGRAYVGLANSSATAEPVAFLNSWTLDQTVDTVDVTAFGDTNKVYVAGLPDASGTLGGWYDTGTAQTYTAANDGLPRKFYLYPDSTDGDYFFGTAIFDFSINTGVADGVSIQSNWKATSTVQKVSA